MLRPPEIGSQDVMIGQGIPGDIYSDSNLAFLGITVGRYVYVLHTSHVIHALISE